MILVACEESQRVTVEFRKLGHVAFSCDLQPPSGGYPEFHIQCDVLSLLNGNCSFKTLDGLSHSISGRWNMIIAFPPCTYLTLAANKYYDFNKYGSNALERMENREKAIRFFLAFTKVDCEHIAIENPLGVMSTRYRKPDCIIQPWMFGEHASKTTCLWLKNLPPLRPTDIVDISKRTENQVVSSDGKLLSFATLVGSSGKKLSWNDPETQKLRSKTFPGVAHAMAAQWGNVI